MTPIRSDLPILNNPEPSGRRTAAQKYGGLYYLGLLGLVVLVGLIVWFALGVWSLWDVWSEVYRLHDESRPVAERIQAAYALSRNPDATQRQYWDIALRRSLPPMARYLLAESLTAEAVAGDPRGYALAVARSPGWPGWFRRLVARPLAYAADEGIPVPPGVVAELCESDDPFLRLWAAYTLVALGEPGIEARPDARAILERSARGGGPEQDFAALLLDALGLDGPRRREALDDATRRLRSLDPEAARVWDGWEERGGTLHQRPAPNLQARDPA